MAQLLIILANAACSNSAVNAQVFHFWFPGQHYIRLQTAGSAALNHNKSAKPRRRNRAGFKEIARPGSRRGPLAGPAGRSRLPARLGASASPTHLRCSPGARGRQLGALRCTSACGETGLNEQQLEVPGAAGGGRRPPRSAWLGNGGEAKAQPGPTTQLSAASERGRKPAKTVSNLKETDSLCLDTSLLVQPKATHCVASYITKQKAMHPGTSKKSTRALQHSAPGVLLAFSAALLTQALPSLLPALEASSTRGFLAVKHRAPFTRHRKNKSPQS